jgi:hypothetical protein
MAEMDTFEALENGPSMNKRPIDVETTGRKKFKTEDLPFTPVQHAAMEKLRHAFKKKGYFDLVRKQLWTGFNEGVCTSSNPVLHPVSTLLILSGRNPGPCLPMSCSHSQNQRLTANRPYFLAREEKPRL